MKLANHVKAGPVRRFAGKIANVIADFGRAQRRLAAIVVAPDSQLNRPAAAPDTYAEFLFRTSGPLPHEPSALARSARGRQVR